MTAETDPQADSDSQPTSTMFERLVFPKEIEEVRRRRALVGLPCGETDLCGPPHSSLDLMGLALSGGGIRSASFCLGVVQQLVRAGVFPRFDYLSTVSGGGYLGAALSNLLNGAGAEHSACPDQFPLRTGGGRIEPPAMRHLRNGSNYLNPGEPLDALMMPTVAVRGFLLTIVCWLPFVLATVLLTSAFYEILIPRLDKMGIPWDASPSFEPILWAAGVFGVLTLAYPIVNRLDRDLRRRERYERWLARCVAIAVVIAAAWPFWILVNLAVTNTWAHFTAVASEWWEATLNSAPKWGPWLTLAGVASGISLAMAVRAFAFRALLGRMALLIVGLSGPLAMFSIYLGLCLVLVGGRFRVDDALSIIAALPQPGEAGGPVPDALLADLRSRHMVHDATGLVASTPHVIERAGHPTVWIWTLHHPVEGSDLHEGRLIAHDGILQVRLAGGLLGAGGMAICLLVIASILLNARFVNVNVISPHGFYRDRLSRVFLTDRLGRVGAGDRVKLSDLGGGDGKLGAHAPYHLINTTLNLHSSSDARLRGRRGDFFILSKHWVGSDQTGWVPTKEVEAVDSRLDLGTAMAVSGAVAAPSMGLYTPRSLSFLLTLLNIRMCYWAPNPRVLLGGSRRRHLFAVAPGPSFLAREALRALDAERVYVNLSDGGHIENLGVYELLRRRCRVIVAVDGEEDGRMRFGSLATLVRFARIDMGIDIEIPVDDIRLGPDGRSAAHHAIGTIHYGPGEDGVLIYIKASLTGDENLHLRAYHEENPTFPHESTADQFFGETQLEVYRALGEHAARGVFPGCD